MRCFACGYSGDRWMVTCGLVRCGDCQTERSLGPSPGTTDGEMHLAELIAIGSSLPRTTPADIDSMIAGFILGYPAWRGEWR